MFDSKAPIVYNVLVKRRLCMIGVFYVHGFASGINYAKLDSLSKTINDDHCSVIGLHYNSDWNFDQIKNSLINQVNTYIDEFEELVFIGTSLGGLFARELANHFNSPMIVINPVTDPVNQLSQFVGTVVNYSTGQMFTFTNQNIQSYNDYTLQRKGPCLTYVSTIDQVLVDNAKYIKNHKSEFGKIIETTTTHQVDFNELPNFKNEFDKLVNTLAG